MSHLFRIIAIAVIVFVTDIAMAQSVEGVDKADSPQTFISENVSDAEAKALSKIPAFIHQRNMGATGMMILIHGKVAFTYGDVKQVSYIALILVILAGIVTFLALKL